MSPPANQSLAAESLFGLSEPEARSRRREWNRDPIKDLFPRIPAISLERILDLCIDKNFTYNLSDARRQNARRYTSIVVAHVRHAHTAYDALLRGDGEGEGGLQVERYDARKKTGPQVWKVLREWCPWDDSNDVLEKCFAVTLLRPEERDPSWDPMDIDIDSEDEVGGPSYEAEDEDPMDLD